MHLVGYLSGDILLEIDNCKLLCSYQQYYQGSKGSDDGISSDIPWVEIQIAKTAIKQ